MARRKPAPTPEPAVIGRPVRLLTEIDARTRFLELIRVGLWQNEAARAVRWSPKSVERWIQAGEVSLTEIGDALDAAEDDPAVVIPEPREPYATFVLDLRQAQAGVEEKLIASIHRASREPRLWGAAAWLLEKKNPRTFGNRTRVEVAGDPDAPMVVAVNPGLSIEAAAAQAAQVLALMAATTGDPTLTALADSTIDRRDD